MSIRAIASRPKVVLLDFDNTLYEYEPAHEAAMSAVRVKGHQLVGVGSREFDRLFERARGEVKGRLGAVASAHSRLLYFQRLIELLGLKTQPLLTLDLEQTYWRSFLGKAALVSGVSEFLDELQLQGVPKALVTDLTAQIQFRKLVYFKLDECFDAVVTSEEAGTEKPDPAPFLLALQKLGVGCQPNEVWMIGDSVEKDLEPAKRHLGATTFLVSHASSVRVAPHAVDGVIRGFEEMTQLVRRLFSGQEPQGKVVGA